MERASVAADAHAAWAGGAALSCLPLFPIAIDISFMPEEAEFTVREMDVRIPITSPALSQQRAHHRAAVS